ncbi:RICIN domain-containing protein [Amycolatopsis sp. NPDC004747]
MIRRLLCTLLAVVAALAGTAPPAGAAPVTVTNATQFPDTSGAGVQAHGGGVLAVGGYYYWFGEDRNPDNSFRYVSVYRSADLRTWEFRAHVLDQRSAPELASANIERPKVLYNAATKKFVMWMHKETAADYAQARSAVAVSDTVDGAYSYLGSFRPLGLTSRDMTLFQDTDGRGYLVSSTNENADLSIFALSSDYTQIASRVANPWPGAYREAPALFKRDGVYFMLTSGTSGWAPNQQRYATATSITGPWSAYRDAGDATTYGSQTAFVLPVTGTSGTSYLYLGDRWGNSFGKTVNDSLYVWAPLSFPTATTLVLPYYPRLTIDTGAGTVAGTGGGPYSGLVARHSGKCVAVQNSLSDNGTPVVQSTCGGGLDQVYTARDTGNGYQALLSQVSGKCLDVSGASTVDGTAVVVWPCAGGANQQWRPDDLGGGFVRLVNRNSGKCLDVSDVSTADGARLIQWTCGGGSNQQFSRPAR